MTKSESIYFHWSGNVLLGGDPVAMDRYLRDNFEVIREVAGKLLGDYEPRTIYRGVLMDEQLTELQPHPNMTYLCFSESRDVATHFGNNVDGFPCLYNFRYGYVAEYTPKHEEILFHWKFIDIFPYIECLAHVGYDGSTMPLQREVTILQPEQPLKLIKWDEFYPDYNRYCLKPEKLFV